MEKTQKNMLRQEIIGLEAGIINSKNSQNNGIHGKIIDETKTMLTIKTKKGIKKMKKNENDFEFTANKEQIRVKGDLLCQSPYERISIKVKQ